MHKLAAFFPAQSVYYLRQQHQVARRARGKRHRDHQQKQTDHNARRGAVELVDRRDEAAVAAPVDADRLHHQHDHLEEEHEEEHHEVEAGVGAERLVGRTVPATATAHKMVSFRISS